MFGAHAKRVGAEKATHLRDNVKVPRVLTEDVKLQTMQDFLMVLHRSRLHQIRIHRRCELGQALELKAAEMMMSSGPRFAQKLTCSCGVLAWCARDCRP